MVIQLQSWSRPYPHMMPARQQAIEVTFGIDVTASVYNIDFSNSAHL